MDIPLVHRYAAVLNGEIVNVAKWGVGRRDIIVLRKQGTNVIMCRTHLGNITVKKPLDSLYS
jgi:hypothetical protein